MIRTDALPVPTDALLARYKVEDGHYTDAFVADVKGAVDLPLFLEAFYTAGLFRGERLVLRLAGHPSTDMDAANLAMGSSNDFAIWSVADRTGTQILLCDKFGSTASWFQVESVGSGTRLWFGSAVIAAPGANQIPFFARVLTPVHKLYSRLLLAGAVRRLRHFA